MNISMRTIFKTMDPITPEKTMRTLANMHQWVGNVPSPLSLLQIVKRHKNPNTISVPFLFYNTYLMSGFTIPIVNIEVGSAPALEERASEIGLALKEDQESKGNIIAALCELWRDGEREILLNAWPGLPSYWPKTFLDDLPIGPFLGLDLPRVRNESLKVTVGADAGNLSDLQHLGAGLTTIIASHNFTITRKQTHTFDERGSKTADADYYSNKGILLTEIDLDFDSNIEVYSTHLFNGGYSESTTPSNSKRFPRQFKQIRELVTFFRETHKSENVAIIVGDFNVNAPSHNYDKLKIQMGSIDLDDIWAHRNGNKGHTSSFVEKRGICEKYDEGKRFCEDGNESANSTRIDYIFMQRPHPDHKIYVDYTRPRRRPFLRSPGSADYNDIKSMSDHLGLETTLIISPK